MKTNVKKVYIILFLLLASAQQDGLCMPRSGARMEDADKFRVMKVQLIMQVGSDAENEDFFNPMGFAIAKDGRIYVLDTGNSRVQCFSQEGKFLFSFGRRGQGPGEFSRNANNIRILEDNQIYVIDNAQYKISVFSLEGKYVSSTRMAASYDDIVLAGDTYFLSSLVLDEKHKPIDTARKLGNTETSFGVFIEPAVGLIRQLDALPNPDPWRRMYNYSNFTNIVAIGGDRIVYSQEFPYRIIAYRPNGAIREDISGNPGFDTHGHVHFSVKRDDVSVTSPPQARVMDMSVITGNQLLVPYLDPEKSNFYVDKYDSGMRLTSRNMTPNTLVSDKEKEFIAQAIFDDRGCMTILVLSQVGPARIEKYKVTFDQ